MEILQHPSRSGSVWKNAEVTLFGFTLKTVNLVRFESINQSTGEYSGVSTMMEQKGKSPVQCKLPEGKGVIFVLSFEIGWRKKTRRATTFGRCQPNSAEIARPNSKCRGIWPCPFWPNYNRAGVVAPPYLSLSTNSFLLRLEQVPRRFVFFVSGLRVDPLSIHFGSRTEQTE